MARVDRLPLVSGNCPFIYRREYVGKDAYAEVRTVEIGIAPIAVIDRGPVDLEAIKDSVEESRRNDLNGWFVLRHQTNMVRARGSSATVYGGGGPMWPDGWRRVLPDTQEMADAINVTTVDLLESGKRFIAAVNSLTAK